MPSGKSDRPVPGGRDVWERDRYIGICDVLLASHKAGSNLAVQDSGRFMELREDELEEEAVWVEAFDDPSICWDLHSDDLEAQSDDMIEALAIARAGPQVMQQGGLPHRP